VHAALSQVAHHVLLAVLHTHGAQLTLSRNSCGQQLTPVSVHSALLLLLLVLLLLLLL
jgi:hypothetical protein